ncbi:MAG: hypothetical protein ABEJ28_11585 [Salinigranum sp.]
MIRRPGACFVLAAILLVATASIGYSYRTFAGENLVSQVRTPEGADEVWISTYVLRTVDREAGVVCYVADLPDGVGVDCLPIDRTNLAPNATAPTTNRPRPAATTTNRTRSATTTANRTTSP